MTSTEQASGSGARSSGARFAVAKAPANFDGESLGRTLMVVGSVG